MARLSSHRTQAIKQAIIQVLRTAKFHGATKVPTTLVTSRALEVIDPKDPLLRTVDRNDVRNAMRALLAAGTILQHHSGETTPARSRKGFRHNRSKAGTVTWSLADDQPITSPG